MIGHSFSSPRRLYPLVVVLLLLTFVVAACDTPSGEELVEAECSGCHTTKIVQVSSKTRHEWFNIVYRMQKLGADVEGDEVDAIIDYLTTNYGPQSAP